MSSMGKDLYNEVGVEFCLAGDATAAGTGDATEINGQTINLASTTSGDRFQSAVFVIAGRAVLADTKTLTITANLQDSADGSTWADITSPAVMLTLTGQSGGTTERGVAKIGYDLTKARQYVRIQATPDLSAASADTSIISAVAVLGYGMQPPVA